MWKAYGYASALDGGEHLALVYGDLETARTSWSERIPNA